MTEIGQQDKLAVDIQTKIEQDEARISGNNFTRIKEDLKKSENKQLLVKVGIANSIIAATATPATDPSNGRRYLQNF